MLAKLLILEKLFSLVVRTYLPNLIGKTVVKTALLNLFTDVMNISC